MDQGRLARREQRVAELKNGGRLNSLHKPRHSLSLSSPNLKEKLGHFKGGSSGMIATSKAGLKRWRIGRRRRAAFRTASVRTSRTRSPRWRWRRLTSAPVSRAESAQKGIRAAFMAIRKSASSISLMSTTDMFANDEQVVCNDD